MFTTSATILTEQGQRLITRLGRHWGHKFDVTLSETELYIPFSATSHSRLTLNEGGLTAQISAAEPERLSTLKQVLTDHLQRFAKDQTLVFPWSD
ncbi:hypothetical protein Y5S_03615 [Alcanivorax nanhaiticus]|uniref:DUF2218 domain-containing protein n=1 Tax=Alcanivorax nanhaiticus TaxID=1177154 RepID=A0A095UJJ1_9GAMM|nr:DUF2218 domain-containing protein [Alcanivorax nanhaiticus]KGD62660.1 hypothetical protein Y5S_03615 [Alcanivorax nanhaiticus]